MIKKKSICCHVDVIKDKVSGLFFCSRCCGITKCRKPMFIWIFTGVTLMFMCCFGNCKAPNVVFKNIYSEYIEGDIALSDSAILNELVKNKCILPTVAITQSRIETGNYNSQVCRENKNLFGIKYHKCKYVKGVKNNHATYDTYKDNIKCYCEIQTKYLKSIDKTYAMDPDYINKIKEFK